MKKLFSYLLISSMVVLSSCTNYDDQFDDLNTQINSLKSQIDGFSSLSSGLTALQGTVSSLQTAVAALPTTVTPATDISGLQSGLTSLEALVKELQTKLNDAATAESVQEIADALEIAQGDLKDLLDSNNIYAPSGDAAELVINTQATLDFATQLGDKIAIVNGDVTIEQTTSMDATELAAVMAKITSVTGDVSYTAKATGVVPTAGFTALTGVATITMDVNGDVSLPVLASASTVDIKDNTKVTSVSLPALKNVTSLPNLTFSKATSLDLTSLERYDDDLTIDIKSGTVNLDAFVTTTTATNTPESGHAITVNGADVVVATLITGGVLSMDSVLEPNFPAWKGANGSSFAKATKVVLPSITGTVSIDVSSWAEKATYFHFIGLDGDDAATTSDDDDILFPSFTTGGSDALETLIIGGSATSVTITGSEDLTSVTFDGSTHALTVSDNAALTSLDLPYTSTVGGISAGSLTITGNDELESVTADSLDDISTLTITGNGALTSISFAALNSLGTDTEGEALAAGDSNVNIHTNDLTASLIQLPSAATVVPAVAGKITSASGLNALKTFIGLAVAKRDTDVATKVAYDNVTTVLDADGEELAVGQPIRLRTATSWSTTNTQDWGGEDSSVDLVNLEAGEVTVEAVAAVYQKQTYKLEGGLGSAAVVLTSGNSGDNIASVTLNTGSIAGFIADDVSTWGPELAEALNAKLDDNGADFTVTVANDFGVSNLYDIDLIDGDGTVSDATGGNITTGTITFTFGTSTTATVLAASTRELTDAITRGINTGASSDTWKATTNSTNANEIKIERLLEGTTTVDNGYAGAFPNFSFTGYSSAASLSGFVPASATIAQRLKVESKGWRITLQNDDTSFNALALNTVEGTASFISGGATFTEFAFNASQTQFHVDTANVVEGVDEETGDGSAINLLTWL